MRNNWLWLMDLDVGSLYNFPVDPVASHSFGGHLFSNIGSFMDNSLHQCRHFLVPGSFAIEGAMNYMSKLAGALLFLFSGCNSSNITGEITGKSQGSNNRSCESSSLGRHITSCGQNLNRCFESEGKFATPDAFKNISGLISKLLFREAERIQLYPMLSLAAALVPPFDNISSKVQAVSRNNTDVMVHRHCEVEHLRFAGLSFLDMNRRRCVVEPRTGFEFPMILNNILSRENNFNPTSEVLVGIGSRIMTIIKIKSLKVYAFGFYVHPSSICEKLGPKYSSISVDELNKCPEFYKDLLREDINMTVRVVVSCNGMKINTVKDAFEKSLRARLVKTNPETDYQCIQTFGSCFKQDIPLPVGTVINFRRTADGQLITEIGGNQIGAVKSKDLCRAFFDMYIGDLPVSEQTKEESGRNIANIIRRC